MLRLKVSPIEFAAMIIFLRRVSEEYRHVPLQKQTVDVLVIGQYLAKWNSYKFMLWMSRPDNKLYWLSLPLPVARALHQNMQESFLGEFQLLFLHKLDQAIVNYRNPLASTYRLETIIDQY